VVLFIQDTSELDFTAHPQTTGLGHIGKPWGRGMLLHSCLAVLPLAGSRQVLGLAAQRVWARQHPPYKGREKRAHKLKRAEKESGVWAEIIAELGPPPGALRGRRWVSVGDRASDIFPYVRRAVAKKWDVLLRVAQDRLIQMPTGGGAKILGRARRLPARAQRVIELRGRGGEPKRCVTLRVARSAVTLCPPLLGPERKQDPIHGWCLRCWEEAPATGQPLEWVLFTTVPLLKRADALEVVGWYSARWLIEEYHKCLKSGCALERRQLETAERRQAVLGFLAVIAVRLLQLRTLSRETPGAVAHQVVAPTFVEVLAAYLNVSAQAREMTLREFWHGVTRLGGFIGRRSDSDPGWQTLWRGWRRLLDLCWGVTAPDAASG
jgi:hypothetical protein